MPANQSIPDTVISVLNQTKDKRPTEAIVYGIDGHHADIRLEGSVAIIRHVEVIGSIDAITVGDTVQITWRSSGRPVIMLMSSEAGSGTPASIIPDNTTIENSNFGLRVKKGGISREHLAFAIPDELEIPDSLTAAGWIVDPDTGAISGYNVRILPSGEITLGTGNDVIKLSAYGTPDDPASPEDDSDYRLWVGHILPHAAGFAVTKHGDLIARQGFLGGWKIKDDEMVSDTENAVLHSGARPYLGFGGAHSYMEDGFWVGLDTDYVYKVSIGASGGPFLTYDGTDLALQDVDFRMYDGTSPTLWIESDGDFSIGSDIDTVGTTSMKIFTNTQSWDSEAFGAGDILIGDHGGAHMLWDQSDGQLQFRDGAVTGIPVMVYVDTDGTLNAGDITLSSIGLTAGVATDFMTGTGIFLGEHTDTDGTVYKMHIGDPALDHMYWDGNELFITGHFIGGADIGWTESDDFIINYDEDAVTTRLILRRATTDGGDASMSWDGTDIVLSGGFANAFALQGSSGNIGLGLSPYDHWHILQYRDMQNFVTPPQSGYNCGGTYLSVLFNLEADDDNNAMGINVEIQAKDVSAPTGGWPTSDIMAIRGSAVNYYENSDLDTIIGGNLEARVYGSDVNRVYALMAQATNISGVDATVTELYGAAINAYTAVPSTYTNTITTLYGAHIRTFGKTTATGGTSAITTAYGLYSSLYNQQQASSTATIGDAYNIYVTPYRPGGFAPATHGLIDNYYGIYIVDPVSINATSRWSLYVEGGDSYFGGSVGIGVAATAANLSLERTVVSETGAQYGIRGYLYLDPDNNTGGAYPAAIYGRGDIVVGASGDLSQKSVQAGQFIAAHSGTAEVNTIQGLNITAQNAGGGVARRVHGMMVQAASYNDVGEEVVGIHVSTSLTSQDSETTTVPLMIGVSASIGSVPFGILKTVEITDLYGFYSQAWVAIYDSGGYSACSAENVYAFYATDEKAIGSGAYGTVTNYYGLYCATPVNDQTANAWAIYVEGGISYFGADIDIDADLHFQGAQSITTTTDNLTLAPDGDLILNPTGNDVLPTTNYDINLGAIATKYLSIHAAELWVETLVAHETMATIGGRVLVGPTTVLTSDINTTVTTIYVKHDQMASGDRVYLESDGKVEFMSIDSAPGGSGPYSYTVTRNLDGSGGNLWYAGDAVLNTGAAGDGFIDLYSVSGVKAGTEYGPTIVGNVRNSATYNDWSPFWAIGNLDGLYGYGSTTYGVGLGKYAASENHLTIDTANGIRFFEGTGTVISQWDGTTLTLGQAGAEHVSVTSTSIQFKDNTVVYTDLTAGVLRLGQVASGKENIKITGTAISFYDNTTVRGSLTGSEWILGTVAYENIRITTSALQLRDGTTVYGSFGATTTVGLTTQDHVRLASTGIQLKDGSTVRGDWQTDGDIFIGSNVAAAATTYFAIFATEQTYNTELVYAGDMLIGDNSDSKANIFWDKSTGRLNFRGGTDTEVYIDTDGTLTAGGGAVLINSGGVFIEGNNAPEPDGYGVITSAGYNIHDDSDDIYFSVFGTHYTDYYGGRIFARYSAPSNPVNIEMAAVNSMVGGGAFLRIAAWEFVSVPSTFSGSQILLYTEDASVANSGDIIIDPYDKLVIYGITGIGKIPTDGWGLHIYNSAGSVAGSSEAGIVIEKTANSYISFVGGTSARQGLWFGDTDMDRGGFYYDHGSDYFLWRVSATTKMILYSTYLRLYGPIKMLEASAAVAHTATYGQFWVKNTVPCEPWFDDDIGYSYSLVQTGWQGMGRFLGTSPFTVTESVYNIVIANTAQKLEKWAFAVHTATDQTAANYWTVQLRSINGTTDVLIDSFTSIADPHNVWIRKIRHAVNTVMTGIELLYVKVIPTGSPGSLYMGTPALFFI